MALIKLQDKEVHGKIVAKKSKQARKDVKEVKLNWQ